MSPLRRRRLRWPIRQQLRRRGDGRRNIQSGCSFCGSRIAAIGRHVLWRVDRRVTREQVTAFAGEVLDRDDVRLERGEACQQWLERFRLDCFLHLRQMHAAKHQHL